jgi:ABC-2 type transport system permease protein
MSVLLVIRHTRADEEAGRLELLSAGVVGHRAALSAAVLVAVTTEVSWLSPIGWAQQLRPFADERWWVLGIAAAGSCLVGSIAFVLAGRRDLGAGLLPTRPGPARAAALLRTPLALAWRLQRATLLAWATGLTVYGAAIGGVADSITDLVEGSRSTRDLLTKLGGQKALIDAFLATAMGILGLVAAIYAVQAVLRLRAEDSALRAEPILATPVGRIRWALSHVVFAVVGSAAVLVPAGLAAGLTHGLRAHDLDRQVPRVLGGALVQLPAVWAIAAVAVVLFGFAPRIVPASWGVLGGCLLLGQLGPVLKLPQWVMDVSPFTHVPKIPGSPLPTTPLVVLTLVAGLLGLLGLLGFRRRDIGRAGTAMAVPPRAP